MSWQRLPEEFVDSLITSAEHAGGRGERTTIETGDPAVEVRFPYDSDLFGWLRSAGFNEFEHQRGIAQNARWAIASTSDKGRDAS